MTMLKEETRFSFVLVIKIFVLMMFIGGNAHAETLKTDSEGFKLFEIDAHTILNNSIKDHLRSQLGSESVEEWSTLDLNINQKDFLKTYFPELFEFNQKLNAGAASRKQHNTTKLMYRYIPKTTLRFNYVELIFSKNSMKPLVFTITSKQEGSNIAEMLQQKYGEPASIIWDGERGKSLYWKKNNDILILTTVLNKFDKPEYTIKMYCTDNLREQVKEEQKGKEQLEEERKKAVKEVF